MKAFTCAWILAGLGFATVALAQDIVVSHGDRYRASVVNSTYILTPEIALDSKQPAVILKSDEKLARCDELVGQILEGSTFTGNKADFVRDRIVPLKDGKSWVIYSQRHQGYPIVGAGARLELDEYGRIVFAGLEYETEKLPIFAPRDAAALETIAAAAVPHPIAGPVLSRELMVDPMGDAPARLVYYVTFQVTANDRIEPWMVGVDAVTGKVADSFSEVQNAVAPPRRDAPAPKSEVILEPIVIDDPGGGGGGGGGGGPTPISVYVDINECIALEVRYTAGDGTVESRIETYNDVLSVYPGSTMTLADATLSSTTCPRELKFNGVTQTLPFTTAPLNNDRIVFTSDCRPAVRASEGISTLCFDRTLYTNRIFASSLTFNTTLSEGAITSVSQSGSPTNFLSVPCQTVQFPPASLTTVDNTRFDEVNAFYQARNFMTQYLGGNLGISMSSPLRIYTKHPEPSVGVTAFNFFTRILYLGAGDAYTNGGAGLHSYDAAKFGPVIHHEMSHALCGQLYGPFLAAGETNAISEGIADFMAATYNNNPAVGVCYFSNYDHVRTCDNQASDFRYSRLATCQYPVATGATAPPGDPHAQGMIAAGLLWDIRRTLGPIATDWILRDALRSRISWPNFAQFGSAVLTAATNLGYECQVRPLLIAREFPGITPGSASPPTGLTVGTTMPDRCKIHVTWAGTATSYKVTWTPDGGVEATLSASQSAKVYDGGVGTIGGGTVKVYSIYCGTTSGPSSVRREIVTATSQSANIRATNRAAAGGGTETLVDWDAVAGAPNWRVLRNGVQMGGILPGSQLSVVDPPGCAGTINYCVEIVDCGGSHFVGPCRSIDRPGSPLAVTMSGPTSMPWGQSNTFTANITGGCGLASIVWWWMTECDPPIEPIVFDPTSNKAPNQLLIEQCDTWYARSTNPLQTSINQGWSHGNYADIKVVVVDQMGATVTVIKRIQLIHSITYTPGDGDAITAGGSELPMQLVWNGSSIALINVKGSSSGIAKLQVFDVAGRRRAEMLTPMAGSSRVEFPVPTDLARGVYFARVYVPGRDVMRRTIVLK